MLIYVLGIISSTFFGALWAKYVKSKSRILNFGAYEIDLNLGCTFAFFSFLSMCLIPSLIVGTGGDYWNYVDMFYSIQNGNTAPVEMGYTVICKLIQCFSSNSQFVFVVFNFLSYAIIFKCIHDYSSNYSISILCFYLLGLYFVAIPQMRQLLAIALVFWAYRYIIDNNFLKFSFLILLASCFHKTALIAIVFYFVLKIRIKFSYYVVICAIFMLIDLFKNSLLSFIVRTFYPNFALMDQGVLATARPFDWFSFLYTVPLVVLLLLYYLKIDKNSKLEIIFSNATIWYIALNTFCYWIPELFRIIAILNIANIVTIPFLLAKEKNKNIRIMLWVTIVLYYLAFIYFKYVVNGSNQLLPYVSIFDWKEKLVLS